MNDTTSLPGSPALARPSYWERPATRRELILLAVVMMAFAWLLASQRERHVIVIPDHPTGATVLT